MSPFLVYPPMQKFKPIRNCPITTISILTSSQPFLQKFPRNSSWEIASTLPALLPATPENPTPVHIHVHHESVRVAYNVVTDLVPKLLPPANPMYPEPDIILHIGLAASRPFFTLEKGAHGRGYGAILDVDGHRFPDDAAEERFPKAIYPPTLHTSFSTSDVLSRWRTNLGYSDIEDNEDAQKKADVRLSPDAGNFMCGFIYYNSLAHYYSIKDDERPVVFLHVPDLSQSEERLDMGREVAIALIRALVQSKKNVGVIDRPETGTYSIGINSEENARAGTDVNFV